MGRNDGTETLSRRGSQHPRCIKLARREREAFEKMCCLFQSEAIMYTTTPRNRRQTCSLRANHRMSSFTYLEIYESQVLSPQMQPR